MTDKKYMIECGRLLLTGEWLPLQYLSAMLGRQQETIRTWSRMGLVTCHAFGRKRTNLYNVAEAFEANKIRPRNKADGRRLKS